MDANVTDTQGPVYQVFERPAAGRPMQAGGSVHAAGPEMALEYAWDVYGRRPTSVELWVVPRSALSMKTKEELQTSPPRFDDGLDNRAGQDAYCIFRKTGSRVVYEEVATVLAASPEQAMAQALEQFAGADSQAWWVFPSSAITSSELPSGGFPFGPQRNKWFRDQRSFPVTTMLRELSERARNSE